MSDDPSKTGLDRKLISLEEVHEMRSWTQSLGCTESELAPPSRLWAIRPRPCASIWPAARSPIGPHNVTHQSVPGRRPAKPLAEVYRAVTVI